MYKPTLLLFFTFFVLIAGTKVWASDQNAGGMFFVAPDYDRWTLENYCITFFPPSKIGDLEAEKLREGMANLDKNLQSRVDSKAILSAFPGIQAEDFEHAFCTFWELKEADFDGKAPKDFLLLMKQPASSGQYKCMIAIRTGAGIVYQELQGFYRGLYNLMGRINRSAKRKGASGEDQVRRFLEKVGVSQNPSDLDADHKDDLLMYLQFDLCDPSDDENPLCGNMANLAFFPVPYSWNGRHLACDPSKNELYYSRFLKVLKPLDREVAFAVLRKLKKEKK